jgi:hypothetical protein
MALKGNGYTVEDDISMTCESVAERGVGLVIKTAGSGIALGDSRNKADLVANPSGYKPAGLLFNDVVDYDVTRYHGNFHKNETRKSFPCHLIRKGRYTTNKVSGTPAPGDPAYLTTNGQFTPTVSSTGGTVATPKVGSFFSGKDADGYATIDINLPQ